MQTENIDQTSMGAGTSLVASAVVVADVILLLLAPVVAASCDPLEATGSLPMAGAVPTAGVEAATGAGIVFGAFGSVCFRLAFTAASRAASLSCRMTFKMRRKKAWLDVLLVKDPIDGSCSS